MAFDTLKRQAFSCFAPVHWMVSWHLTKVYYEASYSVPYFKAGNISIEETCFLPHSHLIHMSLNFSYCLDSLFLSTAADSGYAFHGIIKVSCSHFSWDTHEPDPVI